jgi:hypothetical protein
VYDRDPVAHLLGEVERVRGQQNGRARPRAFSEQVAHESGALRVEADHRLVYHQRVGAMKHGRADYDALAHPVRVSFGPFVAPVPDAEHREEALGSSLDLRCRHPIQTTYKLQKLPARELVVDERGVRNVSDVSLRLFRFFADVVVGDCDPTAIGTKKADEQFQRSGLAGAVRTEQPYHFATRNRQRQIRNGNGGAERFAHVGQNYHQTSCTSTSSEPSARTSCTWRS